MQLDSFTRQRLLKQSLYNMTCFIFGIMSNFLVFYLSILIDNLVNTFDDPSLHLLFIPALLSVLFIWLECKFVSEIVAPDGYFIAGNIVGIAPIIISALRMPNIMEFEDVEYMAYNLLRYLTPVIVYMVCNCILYMILRFKYTIDCYMDENRAEIWERIEETNRQYQEDLKNGLIKEEEPQTMVEKSRSLIERISDMIAKNIDPEYERTEHINDIDIDKVLEERKKNKKKK